MAEPAAGSAEADSAASSDSGSESDASDASSASSSASDSGAGAADMDASLMDRVMRAEEAVAKDASEWGAHDRLVRLLREANLRERLREAREAMSARFPLDETRWREWIADEVRLTKGKRARRGEIVGGLFDRATREILSVPLWLGYLEFSLDQDWDPERRRELYERAAELAGRHFVHGHKIWAAFRAFEASRGGDETETNGDRVDELRLRQLAIPLAEPEPLAEDEDARSAALPPAAKAARAASSAAAAAAARERAPVERLIADAEAMPRGPARAAALAEAHRASVALEEARCEKAASSKKTAADKATFEALVGPASASARCAHERAVAATPTDPAAWLRYTSFLDHRVKVRALSEDAHARAVRGCGRGAGSGAVWAAAIRWSAASSGGDSRDDARALARRAREAEGAPFPSPAANAADDGKKRPERAVDPNERLAFLLAAVDAECVSWEEARAEMAAAHPGWADPALALASTRADRLARRLGDVDAAEATWASFTENEYRDVGEAHAAHAEFLWRVAGKVAEARAVLKRAHCRETLVSAAETSSSDPPGTTREKSRRAKEARPGWAPACEAWIRLERAVGTLEHQLEADAKAGARLRALEADLAERRRAALALDPAEARRLRRAADPNYKKKDKSRKKATDKSRAEGDAERPPTTESAPSEAKKKRRAEEDEAEAEDGGRAAKKARGDGGGEVSDDDDDANANANPEGSDARRAKLPEDPTARRARYKALFPERDENTAFVKNLPFSCEEEDLRAFFDALVKESGASGSATRARVVRDRTTGKSRGFAYVDFDAEAALRAAIMRDGAEFQGRRLTVSRSAPPDEAGARSRGGGRGGGSGPGGGAGPAAAPRRPGGRGGFGLGFRGAGMTPRAARAGAAGAAEANGGPGESGGGDSAPKSNADFRAMLLRGGFKKAEAREGDAADGGA